MTSRPDDPPKHSHYSDTSPRVRSDPKVIRVELPDMAFDLVTDAGVFGRWRLDPGTRILLQEAPELPESGSFLDLGCGVGSIALTMASRRPRGTVWAIDVNERARHLTEGNARRLGLRNVSIASPSDVPNDVSFDVIWSNPPIKIGKRALHDLLATWLDRLSRNGYAILVVNKNLGSDSLATWMISSGWDVQRLCSRQGYRLLRVSRK